MICIMRTANAKELLPVNTYNNCHNYDGHNRIRNQQIIIHFPTHSGDLLYPQVRNTIINVLLGFVIIRESRARMNILVGVKIHY